MVKILPPPKGTIGLGKIGKEERETRKGNIKIN
jgi:hypothetical protein